MNSDLCQYNVLIASKQNDSGVAVVVCIIIDHGVPANQREVDASETSTGRGSGCGSGGSGSDSCCCRGFRAPAV